MLLFWSREVVYQFKDDLEFPVDHKYIDFSLYIFMYLFLVIFIGLSVLRSWLLFYS